MTKGEYIKSKGLKAYNMTADELAQECDKDFIKFINAVTYTSGRDMHRNKYQDGGLYKPKKAKGWGRYYE